jgi:AcrR family transcriptional regulator
VAVTATNVSGREGNARSSERDRLLDLAVRHVLSAGVTGLTLRGMAKATGSNNRMLLYYFGSKERLVVEALRMARSRFPRFDGISRVLRTATDDVETRLTQAWDAISAPETRPFVRLFFEVFGVAVNRPDGYGGWLETVADDLVNDVTATLEREGVRTASARILARELVGCWRGLQMDLLSAGEERRVHLAAQAAVESVCARAAHACERA